MVYNYLCNLHICDNQILEYNWFLYKINENNFYYNNKLINLTKQNKYLLFLFISNKEKILSYEYLVWKIWWDIDFFYWRNLRIYILRLKKSLNNYWIWECIYNIRAEGYKFVLNK